MSREMWTRGAEGRYLVVTEWAHAYVATGLRFAHPSQKALLARVYNLGLAVCVARAIHQVLRVPVRYGAIWAPEDDAGRQLRTTFHDDLEAHGGVVDAALPGLPLSSFHATEVALAARAANLEDCQPFLFQALGSGSLPLLSEVLA